MPLKSEKDIREEIRKLREKGKSSRASGVELAAAHLRARVVLEERESAARRLGEPASGTASSPSRFRRRGKETPATKKKTAPTRLAKRR